MIKDDLRAEYGGEWKKIKQPSETYGNGICGLGCGLSITKGETCYELVGAKCTSPTTGELLRVLLCESCYSGVENDEE
jgi:hypothetical protein